jgi:Swt1-like HEPN
MAGMHQPWLMEACADRSVAGFTQLQIMGGLLRRHEPFGSEVTAAFRANLGDFRSPVDMAPMAYVDPQVRDELYLARGFNPDLSDFTPRAFREIISIAGVGDEVDADDDLARNESAYRQLLRFEIQMRRFIAAVMEAAHGSSWMTLRLHENIRTKWTKKREAEIKAGRPDCEPIEFADIGDLISIMDRNDDWEALFKPIFGPRKENVRESLNRLIPIRNATMHCRIITLKDEATIEYETARILDAIHPFQE